MGAIYRRQPPGRPSDFQKFLFRGLLATLGDYHVHDAAEGHSPYDSTPRGRAFAGELSANYFDIHTDYLSTRIRQPDTFVPSL